MFSWGFQLRRVAEFRKDYEKTLKGLMPDNEKVKFTFANGNVMNVLTNKGKLRHSVFESYHINPPLKITWDAAS